MATSSWSTALTRVARARARLRSEAVAGYRLGLTREMTSVDVAAIVHGLGNEDAPPEEYLGQRRSARVVSLPDAGVVVVKEYLRGGLVRHVATRRHLWGPWSRPQRELHMLVLADAVGARVPEPVATAVSGRMLYRGWLVTRMIPGARPLTALCGRGDSELDSVLRDIGQQLARLVAHRILHVDLHPGNVVVDADRRPWLLDFDRAKVIPGPRLLLRWIYGARWRRAIARHGLDPSLSTLDEHIPTGSWILPS